MFTSCKTTHDRIVPVTYHAQGLAAFYSSPKQVHTPYIPPRTFSPTQIIVVLRCASIGIPWEQRRLPHVIKPQVQEYHPLQTNPSPSVWAHTVFERFDVRFQNAIANFQSLLLDKLRYQLRVVAPLSSGAYFLSANEYVVRVGVTIVVGVRHGVERSYVRRIFVQHEKVSVVFPLHSSSKRKLLMIIVY